MGETMRFNRMMVSLVPGFLFSTLSATFFGTSSYSNLGSNIENIGCDIK